jgi:hypothetical protein
MNTIVMSESGLDTKRKVVSDNEWAGWLRRIRSSFEEGRIREYWEGGP